MGRGTANQRLDWGGSTADAIAFEVVMLLDVFFFPLCWLIVGVWRFGATLVWSWAGGRIGAAGKTPDRGYVHVWSGTGGEIRPGNTEEEGWYGEYSDGDSYAFEIP
jgi:hypothetical protein